MLHRADDALAHKANFFSPFPSCLFFVLFSLSTVLHYPSSFRGKTFPLFSCLSGSFLSYVVCGGSMERHLLAPRQIPDYTQQLWL